jgi:alpha-amylase
MPSVNLSFKVHIPYRLKKIAAGNIGYDKYFDSIADKKAVNKFSDESFLPANKLLHSLIKEHKGIFKVSFSISGTAIELLQEYRPDIIHSFQELAKTGCVEFYAETYYNSLSWLYSKNEFKRQIKKHHDLIEDLFGTAPGIFRNTELIYNNELAGFIADLGYKGILCEGLERILNGRSPNQTYAAPGPDGYRDDFGLLLRNVRLSDDIAFRFDDPTWNEQPLTAAKYAGWLHDQKENICNVNLFFDYETFGIHKKESSGIFEFLKYLPSAILANENWKFGTPSEALEHCYPKDIYNVSQTISFEDKGKECCVSCENVMQHNTLKKIFSLEKIVHRSNIPGALECWGRLQSADHFYYMCNDGRDANDTYRMLNPFNSVEEAYENYKNTLMDFEIKLIQKGLDDIKNKNSISQLHRTFSTMIY